MIKVLLKYFQIMVSTFSFQINLNNSFTQIYINYLNYLTKFNFWNIFECLGDFKNFQKINQSAYILLLIYLVYALSCYIFQCFGIRNIFYRLHVAYFIIHPSIFYFIFSNIGCMEIDNNYYL